MIPHSKEKRNLNKITLFFYGILNEGNVYKGGGFPKVRIYFVIKKEGGMEISLKNK